MYCAEVRILPFIKGKKQLSKVIETARQPSHVCIHVERVIGVVRHNSVLIFTFNSPCKCYAKQKHLGYKKSARPIRNSMQAGRCNQKF